jgi:hypothetical protein
VSIATFPEFLEEVGRLILGQETSYAKLPARTLLRMVDMGQKRIYREVKSRFNNPAYAVTVTNNLAPIPADFQSNDTVHFGKRALIPKPEDEIRSMLLNQPGGDTLYFAESGGSFLFCPAVTDGTAVQGRYFSRLPDLSAATIAANALFQAENDLFLFATLTESAPFFGDDKRIPLWDAKYAAIRDRINADKRNAAFSAGRARRTASTTVLR